MNQALRTLTDAIRAVATSEQAAWLDAALAQAGDETDLPLLVTRARRKVGDAPLGEDAGPLATSAGELPIAHWRAGDAARIALLAAAVEATHSTHPVTTAYRMGDDGERAAITRGLCLFSDGRELRPLALETGRTNSVPLFAALAQHNPYPAAHYSDDELNQMVLKCLFVGVAIEPVLGLAERANPDLSRMCTDYIAERRAAGRDLPVDIWLALVPRADPAGMALAMEHLAAPNPRHRYYAAMALAQRSEALAALEERLPTEDDPAVLRLLRRALD
jgi:hypothetical protein